MNYSTNDYYGVTSKTATEVQAFVNRVYSLMGIGLALSGVVSYLTLHYEPLLAFTLKTYVFLIIGELAFVFFLVHKLARNTINPDSALGMFLFYSGLNGLTLSPILMLYTGSTVTSAFFISGGMFGAMSLWGLTTKKDLTSMGSLAFMGLVGIIIASVVNIFLRSSGLQLIISYVAVGVFIGLTAWDAQKIKRIAMSQGASGNMAVMGALQLYLDFINLFLHILYILGGRRD